MEKQQAMETLQVCFSHSAIKYAKADGYVKKAMAVRKGINKRSGEAVDHRHLGKTSCKRGEYDKAQEYYEKALTIHMEIG